MAWRFKHKKNLVIVRFLNWTVGMVHYGRVVNSRYYVFLESPFPGGSRYRALGWVYSPHKVREYAGGSKRISKVYMKDVVLTSQKLLTM